MTALYLSLKKTKPFFILILNFECFTFCVIAEYTGIYLFYAVQCFFEFLVLKFTYHMKTGTVCLPLRYILRTGPVLDPR